MRNGKYRIKGMNGDINLAEASLKFLNFLETAISKPQQLFSPPQFVSVCAYTINI